VPPIDEQAAVANVLLDHLDQQMRQEEAIEIGLKQSTAQRKNILKAAFAGQLVPQDPNDEPASVLLERIRAERLVLEAPKERPKRKAMERR
jgi:type I restriction enzyme S subunit